MNASVGQSQQSRPAKDCGARDTVKSGARSDCTTQRDRRDVAEETEEPVESIHYLTAEQDVRYICQRWLAAGPMTMTVMSPTRRAELAR